MLCLLPMTKKHTPILSKQFHYGWIIVFSGTLTIAACLGLARFAFGMLLPSMRDALNMSYDQAGFLGTVNFAGYLLAVGLTPILLRKYTPRQLIATGLTLIAVCLFAISTASHYTEILILYTLVGIGSGLANIPIMVLVSYWFQKEKRGKAAGFIVIGSGFAIMFSGFLIPQLNHYFDDKGWRISWLILSIIVLIITLIVTTLIRNTPEEKGIKPHGKTETINNAPSEKTKDNFSAIQILTHLSILYFIFGATYVIYGTFIVTTMVDEYGFAESSAGQFWSWVGFFSLFSGTVFGMLSDRFGRKSGLMAVFIVQTAAYTLAGSSLGHQLAFLSVSLYGVAAFAIPAIMAATIGDYLGKTRAAAGFAIITFAFAIGQTLGPVVAGVLAEESGTFKSSYLISGGLTLIAIVLAYVLPSSGK